MGIVAVTAMVILLSLIRDIDEMQTAPMDRQIVILDTQEMEIKRVLK